MPTLIPIVRDADGASIVTTTAVLDGTNYQLVFSWNERENFWFLTVLDEAGANVLIGDRKLVVNNAIDPYFTGRQPPGLFMAKDTGNSDDNAVEAGYDDIGNRVKIFYFSESELA